MTIDLKLMQALASCQARLRFLQNNQSELSELTDLQALYSLETELNNFIEKKCQSGIIHPDPLSEILASLDKMEEASAEAEKCKNSHIKTTENFEPYSEKINSTLNNSEDYSWNKTKLKNIQDTITKRLLFLEQFNRELCISEPEVILTSDLLIVAALERPNSHLISESEFGVVLVRGGNRKTDVVKAIREMKSDSLGVSQINIMIENAPILVIAGLSQAKAEVANKTLVEAGAKVKLVRLKKGFWELINRTRDNYQKASKECENLLIECNFECKKQESIFAKAKHAIDKGNYRTAIELTTKLNNRFIDQDYEPIIVRAKSYSTALDSWKNKQNLRISLEGIRFSLSAIELQYSRCKATLANLAEELNNLDDLSKKFPNSELESDIKSIATKFRCTVSYWEKTLAEQIKSKKSQIVFNWVMVIAAFGIPIGFVLCVAIMNS